MTYCSCYRVFSNIFQIVILVNCDSEHGRTKTVFVKIVNESTIVVANNGQYQTGLTDFKVKYTNAEDPADNGKIIIKPKGEGGIMITDLTPGVFYFVRASYHTDSSNYKRTYAVYVMTSENKPGMIVVQDISEVYLLN